MKEKIILAAIEQFNRDGYRFHMDDIAKTLKISKKTIYKYFAGKDALIAAVIGETFDSVHEAQRRIYADEKLSVQEKLRAILTAESKYERHMEISRVEELEQDAPHLHAMILQRYTTEWDFVRRLLEQGMDAGIFLPLPVELVRGMLQEGMRMMHRDGFLLKNRLEYGPMIRTMVDIILRGIAA